MCELRLDPQGNRFPHSGVMLGEPVAGRLTRDHRGSIVRLGRMGESSELSELSEVCVGRLIERDDSTMRIRNFPNWKVEFQPNERHWEAYKSGLFRLLYSSGAGIIGVLVFSYWIFEHTTFCVPRLGVAMLIWAVIPIWLVASGPCDRCAPSGRLTSNIGFGPRGARSPAVDARRWDGRGHPKPWSAEVVPVLAPASTGQSRHSDTRSCAGWTGGATRHTLSCMSRALVCELLLLPRRGEA